MDQVIPSRNIAALAQMNIDHHSCQDEPHNVDYVVAMGEKSGSSRRTVAK